MRTLAILAAILLVALQVQAESLQERADEATTQEQPGEDDQDFAVSFEENGLSTLRPSGRRHQSCRSAKSRTKGLETGSVSRYFCEICYF
uniref:Alpha-defensin N-terminal domain-containing protein n=1 Tax=Theropithecus gelada TaxID=9565 RepID=A0A8D2FHI0_THEGE